MSEDVGALVRGQDVAAVTATLEAADGVHTLMVTHTVAGLLLTLINVCPFTRETHRDQREEKVRETIKNRGSE